MPYLNSEPFYFGLDRERFELHPLTPSAMTQAASENKLDTGPVSLVGYFQLEDILVPVSDFCIAVTETAQSVLLFSKKPIQELEGGIFGITDETTTSVQLLRVLLHHRYNLKPKAFVSLKEEYDAFLLIGDNALRQREPQAPYSYRYDLGQEWHSWTGYPFVFCQWVMRKDLPEGAQQELQENLQNSLDQGRANLDVIAKKRRDLDMSEEEVIQYLKAFRYKTGPEEKAAIARFRELFYSLPEKI